jgi:ketosteroid isomerase-like protein
MTEAEAKAVRDAITAIEDSVNTAVDRLDCATAFKSVGDREPMFLSNALVIRKRVPFEAACKGMVEPRTGAVFAVDTLTAHALASDAGYVVREGTYTINFKNGKSDRQYLVMTTIWEKHGGRWQMVHLHESYKPLP